MSLIRPRAPADPGTPLHIKLRPQSLDDVVGHPAQVKSLRTLFSSNRLPHAFLFTGPSGVGKTTLARIVARMLGCGQDAIYAFDAARFSGVDALRELLDGTRYVALSANARKCYLLEEVHSLSANAWRTLLLSIEEPPPHVWWVLCTTEADKVPKTVRTRCHVYNLNPLSQEEIAGFMRLVVKNEQLALIDGAIDLLAKRAEGSMRQALVYLSAAAGITDKDEVLQLLSTVDEQSGEPVVLARMIVTGRGFTWDAVRELLRYCADRHPPETLRLVTVNYTATVLLNTKDPAEATRLMAVLQAFSTPCTGSDGRGVLLCSIGSLLFS